MQHRWIIGVIAAFLLISSVVHAATLEIPTPHTTVSGIGVISGWKCHAGELTVRFDGGGPIPLLYGAERKDVLNAGACDDADVGFVSIWNWGNLSDGPHVAVVYDDGVEFDRSTFTVVTTGEAFLQGASGECVVEDFPASGEQGRFLWNEATQHMELADVRNAPDDPPPPVEHGRCGSHRDTCASGTYRRVSSSPQSQYHLWGCVGSGGGRYAECKVLRSPPEEDACRTDSGSVDMCCLCCGPLGQTEAICTQNPQLYEQCGCGRDTSVPPPEVEQPPFEGHWTFSSVITAYCSSVEGKGELRVHVGRISGWFQQNETVRTGEGTYRRNVRYDLSGSVSETGAVDGQFRYNGDYTGGFTGTLSEWSGSGRWDDTAGCVGRWSARKQR